MKQKIEESKKFVIKNLKWLILLMGVILFLAMVEDIFDQEIMKLDILGYQFISNFLISDFITPIAKIITRLGGAMVLIALTILFLIVIKNKKIGVSIAINLIIVTILNNLLKRIVQRPRPTEFRMIQETGYSFPSGHSMISMAFYGYFIYLIYKNIKDKKLKWGLIAGLSILIITIGTSRIYLGVHYTSDVLAGFTIAVSYLIAYTSLIKRFIRKEEVWESFVIKIKKKIIENFSIIFFVFKNQAFEKNKKKLLNNPRENFT